MSTPCEPWPLDQSCWQLPEGDHDALIAFWQEFATEVLWGLSGRRWGLCERTVRPCLQRCADNYGIGARGDFMLPYTVGGRWYNATTCGCGPSCSCGELCQVYLNGPVAGIESVQIDGVNLEPESYRLDAPTWLVREDGECWPFCQDLGAELGEEGTFGVTYLQGIQPEAGAIAAVSALTYELVRACIPDCDCKLPQRVTQIARQGVAAQFIDKQAFFDNGRTGLYVVDLWLNSVNPNNLPSQMRVISPDHRPPRRTTQAHSGPD